MTKITLKAPLTIDGADVKKITLREPTAGELRGLKLTDLLQLDVVSVCKLVPRISNPPISPKQMEEMNPADFAKLATGLVGFFVDPVEMTLT